jgi:prepilin-type N-terminal cleavage/methylation domain-containing protein
MRTNERGMTLVEALVALAIAGVIVGFSSVMVSTLLRGTGDNVNKQFATQKAISMLEELRALIQTQNTTTAAVLDDYDDGTTNQPLLTTQRAITDPADRASGNTLMPGGIWLFERRVTVQKVRGASDLRLVNVKVYINTKGQPPRLLAEVASILSTIGQNAPPTQVYDVYLIAIENVPGWWLYMQNVVPFVENAMQDLEARHPGLLFRKRWIRKLSYGRDPLYTPYVNRALDSTSPIPSVYFYPGKLPNGSPVEHYYPPDFFTGRISIDGTVTNGFDAEDNAAPYSLADQYNNGMRHPDEQALFNQRVSLGLETAGSPTLRLLLDDMSMRPQLYRNAIVINLHGELFPFPPVRNYSDAAKDPEGRPWIRAVTHPERLHYRETDQVALRVYSYHTNVAAPAHVPDWLGRGGPAAPVTVTLRGINWNPAPGAIEAVSGGVDFDGNGANDAYTRAEASFTPQMVSAPTAMWWSSTVAGGDTVIRLYNSPLKSPCVTTTNPCDGGGLPSGNRLYALEYIPSPVENVPDAASPVPFSTTLATGGQAPKNTARWVITIPTFALPANQIVTIDTQIGDEANPAPSNRSRTYVWRGTDEWAFGDDDTNPALPATERYQFLGDPRHSPYADLKMPHGTSGLTRANALGMGYNRYFDDFDSGTNERSTWPGYSYRAPAAGGTRYGIKNNSANDVDNDDGWDTGSGFLEIDMPRVFQVLRGAVTKTNAVYTTMTGFSYYYVGIGGEIGYDSSNGFANSIPVSQRPFDGGGGSMFEQSITDASSGGVKYVRENVATADYWWGMSWLGELYPDSAWNQWEATGNLATGSGAGTFSRVLRGSIGARLPTGTTLINTVRRTQEEGSTAFFWSGSDTSTFHHRYQDGTNGNLGADGTAIADTYDLPLAGSISNNRPYDVNVNDTGMNPDHFLQAPYGAATTLEPLAQYYQHSTGTRGSGLLAMRDDDDAAFVVVNGLSPAGQSGVAFISRWSFLSLVQSFLASGLYTTNGSPDAARVRQLPRVAITSPNDDLDIDDPGSLPITWSSQWLRWDGLRYTPSYANNWSDDTTIRFTTLYSRDNGRTWQHMRDDSPATAGVRPATSYLTDGTSYSWSVPRSSFPQGNYLIRIEAYRNEVPLHYSFHQYRAFIKRS